MDLGINETDGGLELIINGRKVEQLIEYREKPILGDQRIQMTIIFELGEKIIKEEV